MPQRWRPSQLTGGEAWGRPGRRPRVACEGDDARETICVWNWLLSSYEYKCHSTYKISVAVAYISIY
jgi:hypothetical protein